MRGAVGHVVQAALDAQGDELNLGITDAAIAEKTVNETAFQDSSGKFSPRVFAEVLRASGLNEKSYLDLQRRGDVRQQITHTVSDSAGVPQTSTVRDLDAFRDAFATARRARDLTTIVAKVEAVGPSGYVTDLSLLENRFEFARHLKSRLPKG